MSADKHGGAMTEELVAQVSRIRLHGQTRYTVVASDGRQVVAVNTTELAERWARYENPDCSAEERERDQARRLAALCRALGTPVSTEGAQQLMADLLDRLRESANELHRLRGVEHSPAELHRAKAVRLEAVQAALAIGMPMRVVARAAAINVATLYNWRREGTVQ